MSCPSPACICHAPRLHVYVMPLACMYMSCPSPAYALPLACMYMPCPSPACISNVHPYLPVSASPTLPHTHLCAAPASAPPPPLRPQHWSGRRPWTACMCLAPHLHAYILPFTCIPTPICMYQPHQPCLCPASASAPPPPAPSALEWAPLLDWRMTMTSALRPWCRRQCLGRLVGDVQASQVIISEKKIDLCFVV